MQAIHRCCLSVVTWTLTFCLGISLLTGCSAVHPPADIPENNPKDLTRPVTARQVLMGGNFEDGLYGLFSYVLLRGEPTNEAETARYRAVLQAYLRGLKEVKYYEDVLQLPKKSINITYWPLSKCSKVLKEENYSEMPVTLNYRDEEATPIFRVLAEVMGKHIKIQKNPEVVINMSFQGAPADLVLDALAMASGSSLTREGGVITVTKGASTREPCVTFEHDKWVDFVIPSAYSDPEYFISSYDYARSSLILSRFHGLTTRGPFIVASQSPLSSSKAIKDGTEVFIVDLSRVSEEMFSEAFAYFENKVADDPSVWSGGFDWELIRIHVYSALKMHGAQVLAAMEFTKNFFGVVKDASAADIENSKGGHP